MLGLTSEEKSQALTYAHSGADFMFVPSTDLCEKLVAGSPETIGVNRTLVAIILSREPIRLDTDTVKEYCKGTLDRENTWLLDHGDVKVVPHQYKRPELVKTEE